MTEENTAEQTNTETAEEQTQETTGTEETKAEETKAPEKYELSLSKDSLLDASRVDEISAHAKENGLSNEAAQELLDREDKAVAGFNENQNKIVEAERKAWVEEVKNDPDIGGDKLAETEKLSTQCINEFATPEFKRLLSNEVTGFGDHIEFIKFCRAIGAKMQNAKYEKSNSQTQEKKTDGEIFYGSKTLKKED